MPGTGRGGMGERGGLRIKAGEEVVTVAVPPSMSYSPSQL